MCCWRTRISAPSCLDAEPTEVGSYVEEVIAMKERALERIAPATFPVRR
jgi:hypothetical protein